MNRHAGRLFWLAAAVVVALSACGPVPAPFKRSFDEKVETDLVHAPIDRALIVEPVQGVPPDSSALLVDTVVRLLQENDIPATANPGVTGDRVLLGTAEPYDGRPGILWEMISTTGNPPFRLVTDALNREATNSAVVADQLVRGLKAELLARSGRLTVVRPQQKLWIGTVTGAPGNGNRALPVAARANLDRAGIPLAATPEEATLVLKADVALLDMTETRDRLVLGWYVATPAGEKIAELGQDVAIEKGALDGDWGVLAFDATSALIGPVREVMILHEERQAAGRPALAPPSASAIAAPAG